MSAPRLGRLKYAPAAQHLAGTMPWAALLAGSAIGLAISLSEHQFSRPSQSPATIITTTRAAFIPLVAAVAFLSMQPLDRDLTTSLPAPAWLATAAQLAFAVPVLSLTAWLQLEFTAADLRISEPATAHLPWPSLLAELAAWSAFAITVAAIMNRTRWAELAGPIAALAAIALAGLLALAPLGLYPAAPAPSELALAQRAAWLRSDWGWCTLWLASALITSWASRDRWPTLTRYKMRALKSGP